ncbi:MAG: peptidylprolyl isomerase fpr4 [Claussenomyces sp. TS43310]|nr:MAG: peptidylprolyl isomerase fpr4 [Claussenomyces sp. TS43310]
MVLLPVALYGLEVPPGDVLIPALPDFPATFRISMAAIDPSVKAETDAANGSSVARATLKIIREPIVPRDDDDEDSDDEEYMRALLAENDSDSDSSSEEQDEEEEEANGGPSDPAKSKKARKQAALAELLASVTKDSDDEMEDASNGVVKSSKKGKAKATTEEDEDDEEEDEEDDEDEDVEVEEFIICTLDPEKTYQQPLDITISEEERVYFKVSGTHTIYLTGNYLVPDEDGHNHHHEVYDSDEDEDYDLSPDEDELDLDDMEDDESDDLDALEDPRITEVEDDEQEVPKLVSKGDKKGKNKRAAEEDLEKGDTLDEIMAKSLNGSEGADGEAKLSKKQLKKLKNNKGDPVATKAAWTKAEAAAKDSASAKSDKKVQFAKNLEQGPTGSAGDAKAPAKSDGKGKAELGVKTVKGVRIDDKKLGSGPAAKKGDRVGMRYIGKLVDGKVFDSNKKGKPFSFKLGTGEVIQGWDIGVAGMSVGGERRLTIPANLAYGSKSLPGIPANSTLVFDIKLLEVK